MNALSITLLIVLFCICSIHAMEFKLKLQDVEMEFLWTANKHTILPKLTAFFYDDEIEDSLLNIDQYDDEDWDYDEEIDEGYSEIRKYLSTKSFQYELEDISEEFRIVAEKSCLFTVLTKETTILYKESVRL